MIKSNNWQFNSKLPNYVSIAIPGFPNRSKNYIETNCI